MPKHVFKDFDDFADAINGIAGRFVPTARSEADWWIATTPVERVTVQKVQTGGAATFAGGGTQGVITIGVALKDLNAIRIDGMEMENNSFFQVQESQAFTLCSNRTTRWAGITLPLDHPQLCPDLCESLQREDPDARRATHLQTQHSYVAAIRKLAARVCSDDDCVVFIDPGSARAAEEEIVACASRALETGSATKMKQAGRPQVSRARIIARTLELLDEKASQPVLMRDLCHTAQVSERTLRNTFQEYFGVGPMRLLKVRQLREIRAALSAADCGKETVAHIAARFGVWDFNLFARNYRALYGETPSTTLRTAPVEPKRANTMPLTWIRYASMRMVEDCDFDVELPE